jgi:hypothetical protein
MKQSLTEPLPKGIYPLGLNNLILEISFSSWQTFVMLARYSLLISRVRQFSEAEVRKKITGLKCSAIPGRPCHNEYNITEQDLTRERDIELYHSDGYLIKVK